MESDDRLAQVSILIQAIDRVAAMSESDGGLRSEEHLRTLARIRAQAVAELVELEANRASDPESRS
jgi:hypothetical protein